MTEDGNYNPGPWNSRTYTQRKEDIDQHAGRSYEEARRSGVKLSDLVPESISTDSSCPLIVVNDQTGSMGIWPKKMYEKLPYMQHEVKIYLGEDNEICWAAIGDANNDNPVEKYPLQFMPFAKDLLLEESLANIKHEGEGGGTGMETYELAALYLLHNCHTPNAARPIVIFIGDEKPYPTIDPATALRVARVHLEKRIATKDVFESLKRKFEVFIIRKPYYVGAGGDFESVVDRAIHAEWADLLGEDHVYNLGNPQRVVDVIFGILAKWTKRGAYFKEEIEHRQKELQVAEVYQVVGDPIKWAA